MKKLILIAALVCCTMLSASAQLKVYDLGYTRIGPDSIEMSGFGYLPGMMDTTTMVRVWGPTYGGYKARMSFGYQKYIDDMTVMVGERCRNDDDFDSNILWLHGKKGFCITYNSQATDTLVKFIPSEGGRILKVKDPVQSPSFLVTSDERLKEDIEPVEESLNMLSSLSSVRYRLKSPETPAYAVSAATAAMLEQQGRTSDNEYFEQFYADRAKSEPHYGFIAQQVQEVLPELVHADNDGYLSVDYIAVIPLLVNAIQELKGRLEAVENGEQAPVVNRAPAAATAVDDVLGTRASEVLSQNDPNPFSSDTRIGYRLPDGISNGTIYIYDLQGKQVKRLDVNSDATGVTLHGGDLPAGMYIYSLVAGGKELASKKMILTK